MTETGDGMQVSGPVLRRIAIENFRGFRRRVELDLNASSVVVHGPNGLGKTSFFDAIHWLILGDLERLKAVRFSPADEYIVNAYSGGQPASVQLSFVIDGSLVVAERRGTARRNLLTWTGGDGYEVSGDEAEVEMRNLFGSADTSDLNATLSASGMLQQDLSRIVLESPARERFQIFSEMLGLGRLRDFEYWTKTRSDRASSNHSTLQSKLAGAAGEIADLEGRLQSLEAFAATRPTLERVTAALAERAETSSSLTVRLDPSREGAVALAASAGLLADRAQVLSQRLQSSLQELSGLPTDEDLKSGLAQNASRIAAAEQFITNQEPLVEAARGRLQDVTEQSETFNRVASSVLPLLENAHQCPVCEQPIEGEQVIARLTDRSPSAALVLVATEQLGREQHLLDQARREFQQAVSAVEGFEQRVALREAASQEISSTMTEVTALQSSTPVALALVPIEHTLFAAALNEAARQARQLALSAQESVAVWNANESSEVTEVRSRLEVLRAQASQLNEQVVAAASLAASEITTFNASQQARLEVMQAQIVRLSPVAQDVYRRLDAHPTFTEISLVPRIYRAGNTATTAVADELEGVTANPLLVFSTAQSNIAALSYLIALNWASPSRARMLALDDPLQAMDDVNVLGFADLCRHIRTNRQLFISTHERRFASLLERKLASHDGMHRTVVHEFTGWDRNGPTIKETWV